MRDLKLYSQIKADGTDTERQHLQGPRKLQHEGLCHVLTNDHYMGCFFHNGQKSCNSRTKHQMQEWEREKLIQLIIYNIIHSSKHIVQDNRKDFTKASTNDEIHLSTKNMQHSIKLNTLLVKLFHFFPINVMIEQICKKATTKCSILFTKFCLLVCNFRHETPPHKRTHKTWQPAHSLAWK